MRKVTGTMSRIAVVYQVRADLCKSNLNSDNHRPVFSKTGRGFFPRSRYFAGSFNGDFLSTDVHNQLIMWQLQALNLADSHLTCFQL